MIFYFVWQFLGKWQRLAKGWLLSSFCIGFFQSLVDTMWNWGRNRVKSLDLFEVLASTTQWKTQRVVELHFVLDSSPESGLSEVMFWASSERSWGTRFSDCSYLVDPASSHMLVSKIKPCMSKYKHLYTVKLRTAHYISYYLFDGTLLHGYP